MLSPEQIKAIAQQRGDTVVDPKVSGNSAVSVLDSAWGTPEVKTEKVGLLPEVVNKSVESIKKRGEGVYNAITGEGEKSKGEPAIVRGVQATGQAFGAITDVGTNIITSLIERLPEGVKERAKEQFQASKETVAGKAVVDTGSKAYEELGLRLKEFSEKYPEAAKVLESTLKTTEAGGEIASGILTAEGMRQAAVSTEKIPSKTKEVFTQTKEKIKGITTKPESVSFDKNLEETQRILNPRNKYTPTEVEKLRARGEVKVKGKGVLGDKSPFKKEVASPKPTQQNETLAELVKEGKISSKKLPSENTAIIKQEARRLDVDIDEIVNRPELNKPFNRNTLDKVFDKIENSAKKDLVFIPDSTEAKAYSTVMDVAKEEIVKNSFNNAGLRKSIKAFNARMEQILGKNIYGEGSESIANARIQAAKDVRAGLNTFLADNLESPVVSNKGLYTTKGVSRVLPSKGQFEAGRVKAGGLYKKILQKEAQLLNSADEIGYRTRGTLNKTQLMQVLNENPKLKYTLEAIGLGWLGKEFLD